MEMGVQELVEQGAIQVENHAGVVSTRVAV
jgi:hypothetical protein